MGFILFYSSYVFHLILRLLFCWYKPIYFFSKEKSFTKGLKAWNRHCLHQAMAEDQAANVSLFMIFNKLFTKGKGRYYYGDEDDTISYATAMSFHKDLANSPARGLNSFLRFVDKDHDLKSINAKIVRDLEGAIRLQSAGIISYDLLKEVSEELKDDSWKLYVASVQNTHREIKL